MKPTEFWKWNIPHPHKPGKTIVTRWAMTETDALRQHPTATKVPGTMEMRELPETEDEAFMRSASAWTARRGWESGR